MEKLKNVTNFNFVELNTFDKIFVLVSGGIDSTYLFEMCLQECDSSKVYAVNCFNPFEMNESLKEIMKYERFIQIKPTESINYTMILNESFKKIELAKELRKKNKYSKAVFPCCKYIKHNAFKKHPLFKQPNTVVISGIKYNDGMQRRLFLQSLRTGKSTTKGVIVENAPTFYYQHKEGQLYCYPFRDFGLDKEIKELKETEFPNDVMNWLYKKYPKLSHSGCFLCPVLVVFADKMLKSQKIGENDKLRIYKSIEYYKKMFNF